MSDERLRQLERRWRESGAVSDEAAFIAERIRVGELKRERVRAAAILGHPAAMLIVNHPKQKRRSFRHALRVHGVGAQGWIRALVVLQCRLCDELNHRPRPALILSVLQLAWRWAYCPDGPFLQSQAWNDGNQCGLTALNLTGQSDEIAFRFASLITQFVRHPADDFSRRFGDFLGIHGRGCQSALLTRSGVQAVLEPVLGAWLLGYSDPLPRGTNPIYEQAGSS